MSYLKDREIWLSKVPTGNPPAGFFWKFIQNGKVVVRDSSGNNQMMIATNGNQAITGSLTVTGGITGTISSASYVQYSNVANKPTLVSGSSQVTFLGLSSIPSGIVSGSAQVAQFGYATTGSNGFNGSQSITGSLTVTGQVIAQTLNVQQVTSSIVYSSGSNIFGNNTGNTHRFTGSLQVTGSTHYVLGNVGIGDTNPQSGLYISKYGSNWDGDVQYNKPTGNVFLSMGYSVSDQDNWFGIRGNYGSSSGTANILLQANYRDVNSQAGHYITSKATAFGIADFEIGKLVTSTSTSTPPTKVPQLTISSTGAATFSSNVTATQFYWGGTVNNNLSAGSISIVDSGTGTKYLQLSVSNTVANIATNYTNANIPLTLNSYGNTNQLYLNTSGDVGISTDSISWAAGNRRVLEINGTTQVLIGIKTGNTQKGYIFHSSTDLFLENSNSGGNFLLTQVGAGNITFHTNASEKMRITSTGNIIFGFNQTTTNTIGRTFTTTHASANRGATLFYGINDGGNGGMFVYNIASSVGGHNSQYITFETHEGAVSAGERMRITSGGDVLVGMTSNTGAGITSIRAGLLSGQRTNSLDPVFQAWNQGTSLDNQFVHFYTDGGGGNFRGSIDFNRGAGLVRYNTSSDYRLKSEIEDFNASEIVLNLKPKKYRIGNAEQKTIGFIAHELQEYYPQAVSGIKDQVNSNGDPVYQGVDYSQLTGLLVKAIQEQQSLIESLKSRIEILEQ